MTERSAGGFTLLEVLVAVAVLGIVVVVLARSAVQGMSYEGDATRRTRASLIADGALFSVEAGLKLAAPQAKHEESEVDDEFHVTVDVQPLDLGKTGLESLLPKRPKSAGSTVRQREAKAKPPPSVTVGLFRIGVQVAWNDGLHDHVVTRSSFAYDATAAAEALGADQSTDTSKPGQKAPAKSPKQPTEPAPQSDGGGM